MHCLYAPWSFEVFLKLILAFLVLKNHWNFIWYYFIGWLDYFCLALVRLPGILLLSHLLGGLTFDWIVSGSEWFTEIVQGFSSICNHWGFIYSRCSEFFFIFRHSNVFFYWFIFFGGQDACVWFVFLLIFFIGSPPTCFSLPNFSDFCN